MNTKKNYYKNNKKRSDLFLLIIVFIPYCCLFLIKRIFPFIGEERILYYIENGLAICHLIFTGFFMLVFSHEFLFISPSSLRDNISNKTFQYLITIIISLFITIPAYFLWNFLFIIIRFIPVLSTVESFTALIFILSTYEYIRDIEKDALERNDCPNCGERTRYSNMAEIKNYYEYQSMGLDKVEHVENEYSYQCKNCGHEWKKRMKH